MLWFVFVFAVGCHCLLWFHGVVLVLDFSFLFSSCSSKVALYLSVHRVVGLVSGFPEVLYVGFVFHCVWLCGGVIWLKLGCLFGFVVILVVVLLLFL